MANNAKDVIKLMKAMEEPDFGDDLSSDPEERAKYHENMANFTLQTISEMTEKQPITKELLRQYILIEGANAIRAVSDRAKGKVKQAMDQSDIKSQDMLFNAVIPILQQAGDLKKIEVTTVKEVVRAISKGEITIVEAKELIKMIKDKPIITIT